jgi:hypothetical protein
MMLAFLQIGLPAALLLWLALFPAKGWLAFVLQGLSVGAILLALALAAMDFWARFFRSSFAGPASSATDQIWGLG